MLFIKRNCSNFKRISAILANRQLEQSVEIRAWIKNIRRLKNHIFFDVNDGSTCEKFQIVVPKNETTKVFSAGSLVKAFGGIQLAPQGHMELHSESIELIADGQLKEGYPFSPKQVHPPEYVREYLHLRSRINYIAAIMRIRHRAQKLIHDFMDEQQFIQINTPILTTNDCEGAGEIFTVRPHSLELLKGMVHPNVALKDAYFDSKVFLTVSGQMHLECMSYGLGNTYTFNPAFRAENCKSPLHLSEFYMFEAEISHLQELPKLCLFIEKMIKEITQKLLHSERDIKDLKLCWIKNMTENKDTALEHNKDEFIKWLDKPWPLITYKEASEVIEKHRDQFKTAPNSMEGFSKEQELFLVKHYQLPIFIIDWPKSLKPFYMLTSRQDPNVVHALDLIMPVIGELCGGSLRENDIERLRKHPKFPQQNLDWYLELRKYGGVPTGGFGMGFERYLQLITGVKNIRDVIPFPRFPHNCKL